MGNQTSRPIATNSSCIGDDPCLDNIRQWHDNNERYKRQYPLPAITVDDSNHIKPRKQSSPAAVSSNNNFRKPFSRFFNRSNKSLPRNNSCVDSSLSIHTQPATPTTTKTKIITDNKINTGYNITPNTTNSTNTTNNSSSSSFNSQPHYVHPLAPPSIISIDQRSNQYETDPRQSFDSSRRYANRDSLKSNKQLKLLMQQIQLQFKIKDNRKYHQANGSNYLLPCDDEEVDRLHLQHFMVRFAIQGNYLAPVSDVLRKGGRVLDIGCGPGSWSMEIAGEYSKTTVVGIDISPIYPREIKPTNCAFYQCNVLKPLPFEDNTFDYIFMRFMCLGIESDKWTDVLNELIRVLKPNGWIEWVENDIEIHRPGPVTFEFNNELIKLMIANKQDPHIARTLADRLTSTDELIHVSSTFISCPGGQWAGKLGQLTIQSWKAFYQALRPLLAEHWGITNEEYNDKLRQCWSEADKYRTFENVHFSYAQKRSTPISSASSIKG